MICPRCKSEHITYDINGNLVAYEPSVCVICAYPIHVHFKKRDTNRPKTLMEMLIDYAIRTKQKRQVKTSITDEDMLKLHIDIALKNNDREAFISLTNQLREMGNNATKSYQLER